jgi:SAM-dependent methyltransferase
MRPEVARLFDAMAEAYDVLEPWDEHLYARLHAILRASLPPAPPGGTARALDAGCGTGLQTAILAERGYTPHGVDLAHGLLLVARRRLPAAPLARGDLESLPYRTGAFAVAVCCGSTLSFVPRPAVAVAELARVLAPGGLLLLEVEHRWSLDLLWALVSGLTGDRLGYGMAPRELWRRLARAPREGLTIDYPCALPGEASAYTELRLFTATELAAHLRAAGLVPVRAWGIHAVTNVLPSTRLQRPLGRALGGLFRALRAADAFVAERPPGRWLANSLVVAARRSTAP